MALPRYKGAPTAQSYPGPLATVAPGLPTLRPCEVEESDVIVTSGSPQAFAVATTEFVTASVAGSASKSGEGYFTVTSGALHS